MPAISHKQLFARRAKKYVNHPAPNPDAELLFRRPPAGVECWHERATKTLVHDRAGNRHGGFHRHHLRSLCWILANRHNVARRDVRSIRRGSPLHHAAAEDLATSPSKASRPAGHPAPGFKLTHYPFPDEGEQPAEVPGDQFSSKRRPPFRLQTPPFFSSSQCYFAAAGALHLKTSVGINATGPPNPFSTHGKAYAMTLPELSSPI